MKQQRDTLKRYQQRVEKLLETERELAKRLLSENKREYVRIRSLLNFNAFGSTVVECIETYVSTHEVCSSISKSS